MKACLGGKAARGLPFSSAEGRARVAEWLESLARTAAGKSLNALLKDRQPLAALLAGVAAEAPYLWDLVRADPVRLVGFLTHDPEDELARLLEKARTDAAAARNSAAVMRSLRHMKARAALLIALADIGGGWPLARVTAALTDVAETALGAAVRYLLREARRGGKLILRDRQQPETGSGYIVVAMGKMGGYELNFSSDIDLMIFFDPGVSVLDPRR